jgi:cytochrome b561
MRSSQRDDGSRAPFDLLTITIHWLTVLLISLSAATGLAVRYAAAPEGLRPFLLETHRSAGAIIWGVTLVRLLWRMSFARFPPFPPHLPRFQQWLARRSEHLLYTLLLLQPLSGAAMTASLGRPFQLVVWTVPTLLPRNLELWLTLLNIHRVGAYALFFLVAGHAFAALAHHYVLRDDVLQMMAPWIGRKHSDDLRQAPERARTFQSAA